MAVENSGDIYTLPEDCIATALSLTSPKDACRLSLVAATFRSASKSDAVWDRFLPSDYRDIISRAVDGGDWLAEFHSKKDLYLHLCDHPIVIDGGRKSFSLEKLSGKKCYMLAARDLDIVWGDTPQYWKWVSLPESRFSEVAELLDVCWFELRGKIKLNMLSPGTNYAAYLVFTCKTMLSGFDHQSAEGHVGVSGSGSKKRILCLDPEGEQRHRSQIVPRRVGLFIQRLAHVRRGGEDMFPENGTEYPKQRNDGWMEVELGECFVEAGEDGGFYSDCCCINQMEVKMDIEDLKKMEDEEGSVMKMMKGATTGLVTGTIWGMIVATWHDVPRVERNIALPGLVRTLKMMGNHGATFAAIGGLYMGAEQLAQKQRMKRDYINGAIGGFVAGATVFGFRGKSISTGMAVGGAFAATSAIIEVLGIEKRETGRVNHVYTREKRPNPNVN